MRDRWLPATTLLGHRHLDRGGRAPVHPHRDQHRVPLGHYGRIALGLAMKQGINVGAASSTPTTGKVGVILFNHSDVTLNQDGRSDRAAHS